MDGVGSALEPKVLLLERLEKRANAQNALIARRDSLARELGTVTGRPAPAGPDQSVPPAARPPAAEKPVQSKPAASGSTGPGAAPSAPGAPPAHAISVAAYVERQANTAKIRFNSLTPFTSALGYRGGKSLTSAGVVVTLDTTTPALVRLLYALEKGDRLMRIESMEIHRDLKKGQNVTATLHIVGYEAVTQ